MCPYCGGWQWQNSWGRGNAKCVECGKEFDVVSTEEGLKGRRIEGESEKTDTTKRA